MDIKRILQLIREQTSGYESFRLGKNIMAGKAENFPKGVNIPALKAGLATKKLPEIPLNVVDAYKKGLKVAKDSGSIPNFPKGMRYFTPTIRQAILAGFTKGSKNATKG
jgi:hypothetical protein